MDYTGFSQHTARVASAFQEPSARDRRVALDTQIRRLERILEHNYQSDAKSNPVDLAAKNRIRQQIRSLKEERSKI